MATVTFQHIQKVQALTQAQFSFCEFHCPYCNYLNVIAKNSLKQYLLCFERSCHRPIEVQNFNELID